MTSGLVTAISTITTILGLTASAAYAVTFYILNYNELYLSGQSGYDDTDLPYTYAIVECAIAAATFIIGVLAFSTGGRPRKKAVMIALAFFSVSAIISGTFGMLRAWNLGIIGDDMEKTCSDVGQATGCPTTRFEYVHDREIVYKEPAGGDCTFWFWGDKAEGSSDSMERLFDIVRQKEDPGSGNLIYINAETAAEPTGQYKSLMQRDIETYMDWSEASSYGWRDDPNALIELAEDGDSAETLDLETLLLRKVHNMKVIMDFQEKIVNADAKDIVAADRLTEQPSLAYCWYWGCSRVCHGNRYLVNRWWLGSSLALFLLEFICVTLSAVVYKKTPGDKEDEEENMGVDLEINVDSDLEPPPLRGRRKRQLVQNPSGLMF
jgi:hypothetical protein